MQRMRERGVTFKLNTRVVDARSGSISLSPSEEIATETFVWTAGATPNPILKELPVNHDSRGAVLVDRTLAVPGYGNVWALGDCAAVPDIKTGKTCPPTAQAATREAAVLTHNIRACLLARPLREFCFKSLGTLCIVGYHTACAEIRGIKFSGLFAWLLWRGIYLSKLPGLERKMRVLTDWTLELFFPGTSCKPLNSTILASARRVQKWQSREKSHLLLSACRHGRRRFPKFRWIGRTSHRLAPGLYLRVDFFAPLPAHAPIRLALVFYGALLSR
jgi:Pyridine nucleotide-disulphide oxidoreductase